MQRDERIRLRKLSEDFGDDEAKRELDRIMWRVTTSDCLIGMRELEPSSIDALITDPPYGLKFMGRDWDKALPDPEVWIECLRVMKPGAHGVIFGAPRLYHRLACQVEDAGFEIRDCLMWLFGSAMPMSLNVSKAIDDHLGAERATVRTPMSPHTTAGKGSGNDLDDRPWLTEARERGYHEHAGPEAATPEAESWQGWGTNLKTAYEPILLVRKPLMGTVARNVLEHGTGGINIDACRILVPGEDPRWPANLLLDEEAGALLDAQTGELSSGARSAGMFDALPSGKLLDIETRARESWSAPKLSRSSGGASRFFYQAKASRAERDAGLEMFEATSASNLTGRKPGSKGLDNPRASSRGSSRRNIHPTVKPIELMRYLVRLITPPGATVLDPFSGSGSTGCAARIEGAKFIGFEMDPKFAEIARARIEYWEANPPVRGSTTSKASSKRASARKKKPEGQIELDGLWK